MRPNALVKFILIIGIFAAGLLVSGGGVLADKQILYKKSKSKSDQKELHASDEDLLNELTHIRHLLMSGQQKRTLSEIRILYDHLKDKSRSRSYRKIGLILLRIGEGREQRYLYFPPSFETKFEDGILSPPKDTSLFSFEGAKRDPIVASLKMNTIKVQNALNRAFSATLKNDFEDADERLQDLYSDMIKDAVLEHDPVRLTKDALRKASTLLKEGKTEVALLLVDKSEVLLAAHIRENPDAPHMTQLKQIMKGYDKIRAFKYGTPDEVPTARIKIFNTVSGMRGKLKPLNIRLDL